MLNAFIQKRELVKISIIKYLEQNYKQQATIHAILNHLEISEYLLETSLDGLQEDFLSYHLEDQLMLIKEDKMITLKKSEQCSTDVLYGIYLRESLGFKIMKELFNGSFKDIYQFSEKYFVSYANVYRQIQSIKKILKEKKIILTNDYRLKGDELQIRLYYLKLYLNAYNNTKRPLMDKKKEIVMETVLHHLEQQTKGKLSKTLVTKITCFLGISLMRMAQKIYLEKAVFPIPLNTTSPIFQETFQFLTEEITPYFKHEESLEQRANEVAMLIAYLIGEGVLPYSREDLNVYYQKNKAKQELIQRVSASFISALIHKFQIEASSHTVKQLAIGLEILHFKLFCFDQLNHQTFTNRNIDFLKQTYSASYRFCKDFMKWLEEENSALFLQNYEDLFFDYLLLLISLLPVEAVMKPIKVCVDFSMGPHYNQMIINELNAFQSFYLEITDVLDEFVNLYLSDNLADSEQFPCETILWSAPPTGADWKNISNILVKLKNGKGASENET